MHDSESPLHQLRARYAEILGGRPEVQEWEIAVLHRARPAPDGRLRPGGLEPRRVRPTRESALDAFRLTRAAAPGGAARLLQRQHAGRPRGRPRPCRRRSTRAATRWPAAADIARADARGVHPLDGRGDHRGRRVRARPRPPAGARDGLTVTASTPGSRPVWPSSRSNTGASSGTGTTGPYIALRISGRARRRARPRTPGSAAPRPGRRRRAGRWRRRGPSRAPAPRSARPRPSRRAGMRIAGDLGARPPSADGCRHAATSASSCRGSRVAPVGGQLAASGRGPPACGSFSAPSRKATVSPSRWSSSAATGGPAHGVGSVSWSSRTPATTRATAAAVGARSGRHVRYDHPSAREVIGGGAGRTGRSDGRSPRSAPDRPGSRRPPART